MNQKHQEAGTVDEVAGWITHALELFGRDRLPLHSDYGFATFAENPICCTGLAEEKPAMIAKAAERFR